MKKKCASHLLFFWPGHQIAALALPALILSGCTKFLWASAAVALSLYITSAANMSHACACLTQVSEQTLGLLHNDKFDSGRLKAKAHVQHVVMELWAAVSKKKSKKKWKCEISKLQEKPQVCELNICKLANTKCIISYYSYCKALIAQFVAVALVKPSLKDSELSSLGLLMAPL